MRASILGTATPAILALALALAAPASASAGAFKAGETHRTATTASAGLRARGDDRIRIVVWYPAPPQTVEQPQVLGPASAPEFRLGETAPEAAFAGGPRRPVILMSHGFGGTANQMEWLGAPLAREGYVVIAVDHPGTNGIDGVTAEGAYTPWERPGDLKAALDAAAADPAIGPHLDLGRVGAAGFSLGGFTAALLAGARADLDHFREFCDGPQRDAICNPQKEFPLDFREAAAALKAPELAPLLAEQRANLGDPRVRAAFMIAPALVQGVDLGSLTALRKPVEVVLGDADPVVPPKSNGEVMTTAVPGARLVVLPHVGHYDFLAECAPAGRTRSPGYCTDAPDVDRAQTHAATVREAITFFAETLK